MKLLLIEDNLRLGDTLARALGEEGWQVELCRDGDAGAARLLEGDFAAVVLDWMLPGREGIEVLREARRRGDKTPVLMLTAKDEVKDRIAGLSEGADDYLVKPFSTAELVARLHALIRRTQGAASDRICVGDLVVDTLAKRVTRGGNEVVLSAREYGLLECLARNRGRVLSRSALFDALYDHADEISSNVIDVYVGQLRRKIDAEGAAKLIHTRRGLGYVLEAAP